VKGLAPEESARYLSALAEIKASCRLYDTHVHPYEVLFDRFGYQEDASQPGVLSVAGRSYRAPALASFRFPEAAELKEASPSPRLSEISLMLLKKVYGSVGERVFTDQMELSRMDTVLLLPVACESADAEEFDGRMRWLKRHYGDRDRFWIAGSIPPSLSGEEIGPYARRLQKSYGIRGIKCHPVVSGIDLGTSQWKSWLETMLEACHELRLPLVIHGGRNNPYWGGSRGNFGSLHHLEEIDFSSSSHPVILAHAGMHRCRVQDMEQEGLPMLERMLNRHENLRVDISGLAFDALLLVLRSVDLERVIFGSDALYSPQWEVATMTMHALKELGARWEERFLQIASINPERTIFKGDSHV